MKKYFLLILMIVSGTCFGKQTDRLRDYNSMNEDELFQILMECSIDTLESNPKMLIPLAVNYEFVFQNRHHYDFVEGIATCKKIKNRRPISGDQTLWHMYKSDLISWQTFALFDSLSRPLVYIGCTNFMLSAEAGLFIGVGVGVNSVVCTTAKGSRWLYAGLSFNVLQNTSSLLVAGAVVANSYPIGKHRFESQVKPDDFIFSSELYSKSKNFIGVGDDSAVLGFSTANERFTFPLDIKIMPLPRDFTLVKSYFFDQRHDDWQRNE